jgi:hypothetical protein
MFSATRLMRAIRAASTQQDRVLYQSILADLAMGSVDIFAGFYGSGHLWQFNPKIFVRSRSQLSTPGAAVLIP